MSDERRWARVAEDNSIRLGYRCVTALGWTEWGTYAVSTPDGRQEIEGDVMRDWARQWREANDPHRGFGALKPLASVGAGLADEDVQDPLLKLAKHLHELAEYRRAMDEINRENEDNDQGG